jgi:hypothetical protein
MPFPFAHIPFASILSPPVTKRIEVADVRGMNGKYGRRVGTLVPPPPAEGLGGGKAGGD